MSDNLLLAVVMSVVGTSVGMVINLKERKNYFDDFDKLLCYYGATLAYSRNTVPEFLKTFETQSHLLKKQIESIVKSLSGKSDFPSGFLSKKECAYAKEVFTSIGTHSLIAEKAFIEDSRSKLKSFRDIADSRYTKLGSSSIKLGFLFGLMLAVIFW